MNDYVTKPINADELDAVLERWTSTPRQQPVEELDVAGANRWIIRPSATSVSWN